MSYLGDQIEAALAAGQRLFIGFDFAFGYPTGFAQTVTGRADPLALWDWLAARIEDGPDNANNRFQVAAAVNRLFPGLGPFWGRPAHLVMPDLPDKGRARHGHGLTERRAVEALVPRAQPVWKLFTTGSVGSQSLLGIARLAALRHRFGAALRVWPFETREAPITLAEIYPSLPGVPLGAGQILDARQVQGVWDWMAAMSPAELAHALTPGPAAAQEGWIFGVGPDRVGP